MAVVSPVAFSEAKIAGTGRPQAVTGVDGATLVRLYKVKWEKGGPAVLSALSGDRAVVSQSFASSNHLQLGAHLSVLAPSGRHVVLVVGGIVTDRTQLFGAVTVSRALVERDFPQGNDGIDFVGYARGATDAQVQPAINKLLAAGFPQATSDTTAQYEHQVANQVDTLLGLIYVLLALAVVVSLFGLVNTLVLSVYERTRELGTLRAVGAGRAQVRQTVRYESVITSLIGAVTGVAMGALFGGAISRALGGAGFVLSVPFGTLAALLVVAALAGVAAAALPARRAAQMDVLNALSYE